MASYLASLEQRLTVETVTTATLARVAQMHQRTNQFNLTTRAARRGGDRRVCGGAGGRGMALLGKVDDRFGDHGVVIAATAAINGEDAEISDVSDELPGHRTRGGDRVSGRAAWTSWSGVGVKRVTGRYLPTAKNGLVREFYAAPGSNRSKGGGRSKRGRRDHLALRAGRARTAAIKFLSVNVEI